MLSHADIIKKAYRVTFQHKILWLFGFFAVGGFNLDFLRLQHGNTRGLHPNIRLLSSLRFFQNHPAVLAEASAAVLLISLMTLIVANWSHIMLVLSVDSVVRVRHPDLYGQLAKSRRPLWPTIKISLLTTSLMALVAAGLLVPPFFLVSVSEFRLPLLAVASALLLPLAFTISCLNIFANLFVILFQQKLAAALNLATDFFGANWAQILGLAALLMVIYAVCYLVGISLIYIVNVILRWLILSLGGLGDFGISAIMSVLKLVLGLALWLLLAGLNVFFNTSILLLFLQLVTPIKVEQAGGKEMAAAPEAA